MTRLAFTLVIAALVVLHPELVPVPEHSVAIELAVQVVLVLVVQVSSAEG